MSIFDPIDRLDLDPLPLPRLRMDYRCAWCLRYLPADGLCRCHASLVDLEQARSEARDG